jgi:hypothetical protein
VEKYPKSDDAAALRYRYAQYLEQFKQMKDAKRMYLKLLTSASVYKDSAFAAIRRLRKVRGAPETLEEKVAYAKMACAKDNANEFHQHSGFHAGFPFAGSGAPAAGRFLAEKASAEFVGYGDSHYAVGKACGDVAYIEARRRIH